MDVGTVNLDCTSWGQLMSQRLAEGSQSLLRPTMVTGTRVSRYRFCSLQGCLWSCVCSSPITLACAPPPAPQFG